MYKYVNNHYNVSTWGDACSQNPLSWKTMSDIQQNQYAKTQRISNNDIDIALLQYTSSERLSVKSELTHLGRDKMAAIFRIILLNGFSWIEMY